MPASRDDIREHVQLAAARVAASYGLEIFDVQIRREAIGWVVRVVIDRPDPGAAASVSRGDGPPGFPGGEPVGIEDCQHVSRDLSTLLDVEDDLTAGLDKGFTLEVSSPGLDRPLRGEADYRRFVGRLAKVVTKAPVDGQSHFAGRLAGVEDGRIVMTEGRRTHRVPMDLVSRARLDIEF